MTTPTPLGRHARGLPRYYLDVGWQRHPAFVGIGVDGLALFPLVVGYATEHGTDGRLPATDEELALGLGVRLAMVERGVAELVGRGVLIDDASTGHLMLAGWADHNPTRIEVEEHARERSQAGTLGNHRRWHEGRGITVADCVHCAGHDDAPVDRSGSLTDRSPSPSESQTGEERSSLTPEIAGSDRCPIANPSPPGSHGMGWDGMGTTDDDERSSRSLPNSDPTGAVEADALDHLEAHIVYRGAAIRNPAGFRVAARHDVLAAAAHGRDLEALWPTRDPAPPPTPDHLAGTGRLGAGHDDASSDLIGVDDRGAAVVDIDALRTRSTA